MSFESDMEDFNDQYVKDAEASGMLPDGSYLATIRESRVVHDESQDRWSIVLVFQSQGGEGSIRKWYNLDHEVSRRILATDMRRFGYVGDLAGLKEWIEAENLIDVGAEIKVETKPGQDRDFTNVYINRVLGQDREAALSSAAASDDDDIPF